MTLELALTALCAGSDLVPVLPVRHAGVIPPEAMIKGVGSLFLPASVDREISLSIQARVVSP